MVKKIAAFIVAPTWHKIMAYALQKYSSTADDFPPPAPNPNEASLPPVLQGNWNTDPAEGIHDILYLGAEGQSARRTADRPASDPQFGVLGLSGAAVGGAKRLRSVLDHGQRASQAVPARPRELARPSR